MPQLETSTGVLEYELLGTEASAERPALTLLHNFMSTGRSAWGALLDALTPHFRILLPDLPGHGRSLGYPAGFDHRVMAAQIAELMAAAGFERGHLAGCSSGGMIAQLLIHHRLVQPATLTLVSTTYSTVRAVTEAGAHLTPENFLAGRRWLDATARLHDPYRYEGYFEEVLLPGFRRLTSSASIDLPLDALTNWSLPVCIIHGAEDEFFPTLIPERMAAALPDAELHLVPGQTHALIFRQPWQVRSFMLAFLLRYSVPHAARATG